MSVESENKDEEIKVQAKKTMKQRLQQNWQISLKILELLICSICIGFIYDPASRVGLAKNFLHHIGIMYTAFTGFILINVLMIISRLIGDKIPFKTSALFSISGAALFLITAILLIIDRTVLVRNIAFHPNAYRMTLVTTTICFAFLNVTVFTIDALFTFKRQEDF